VISNVTTRHGNLLNEKDEDSEPEDVDQCLIPSFESVRNFIFESDAFTSLKENLRNYVRDRADPVDEIFDFLVKNEELRSHWPRLLAEAIPNESSLRSLLDLLLYGFALEIRDEAVSSAEIAAVVALQNKTVQLSENIRTHFDVRKPNWHFFNVIIKSQDDMKGSSADLMLKGLNLSQDSISERIGCFISNSYAFSRLKRRLRGLVQRPAYLKRRNNGLVVRTLNFIMKLGPKRPRKSRYRVRWTCVSRDLEQSLLYC
jgi:hypothetical protein